MFPSILLTFCICYSHVHSSAKLNIVGSVSNLTPFNLYSQQHSVFDRYYEVSCEQQSCIEYLNVKMSTAAIVTSTSNLKRNLLNQVKTSAFQKVFEEWFNIKRFANLSTFGETKVTFAAESPAGEIAVLHLEWTHWKSYCNVYKVRVFKSETNFHEAKLRMIIHNHRSNIFSTNTLNQTIFIDSNYRHPYTLIGNIISIVIEHDTSLLYRGIGTNHSQYRIDTNKTLFSSIHYCNRTTNAHISHRTTTAHTSLSTILTSLIMGVIIVVFVMRCKKKQILVDKVMVLIIGISQFDERKMLLDGVRSNVKRLKSLWKNDYKYDVFVCNEDDFYITKNDIIKFIDTQKTKLESEQYQCVITHIISHGLNDGVAFLSSDLKPIHVEDIINTSFANTINIAFNHVCRTDTEYDYSIMDTYSGSNCRVISANIEGNQLRDCGDFTECVCDVFRHNLQKIMKSSFDTLIASVGVKLVRRNPGETIHFHVRIGESFYLQRNVYHHKTAAKYYSYFDSKRTEMQKALNIENKNEQATYPTVSNQSLTRRKIVTVVKQFAKRNDNLVTVFGYETNSNTSKPAKQNGTDNGSSNNPNNNFPDKNKGNNNGKNSGGSDDGDEKKNNRNQSVTIDTVSDEEEDEKAIDQFFELLAVECNLDDDQLSEQLTKFTNLKYVFRKVSPAVNRFNQAIERICLTSGLQIANVVTTYPSTPQKRSSSSNGYSSKSETSYVSSSENESSYDNCKKTGKKKKRKKRKKSRAHILPKTYKYDLFNPTSLHIANEQTIKDYMVNTKWYHPHAIQNAEIYGATSSNGRLTLSLEVSEVMRRCEKIVNKLRAESGSVVLESVNMKDSNDNSMVQYLLIAEIDDIHSINIGISFQYIEGPQKCDIVLTGFHLDLRLLNIAYNPSGLRIGYLNIYSQTEQYYERRYRMLLPFIREFILQDENKFISMYWKMKAKKLWKDVMGTTIPV